MRANRPLPTWKASLAIFILKNDYRLNAYDPRFASSLCSPGLGNPPGIFNGNLSLRLGFHRYFYFYPSTSQSSRKKELAVSLEEGSGAVWKDKLSALCGKNEGAAAASSQPVSVREIVTLSRRYLTWRVAPGRRHGRIEITHPDNRKLREKKAEASVEARKRFDGWNDR